MAKVTFTSLKLKIKDEVKKVTIADKEVEVKQYLSASDKYDLIMISLQEAKENSIYNDFKIDVLLHLNMVFMYTNLSFTDKQREDLFNLYDILESNDVINTVIQAIPQEEIQTIYNCVNKIMRDSMIYENSVAGVVNTVITQMPVNAAAAAEIVDNFNPEKYSEVMNFAKAIGMRE